MWPAIYKYIFIQKPKMFCYFETYSVPEMTNITIDVVRSATKIETVDNSAAL